MNLIHSRRLLGREEHFSKRYLRVLDVSELWKLQTDFLQGTKLPI
jgi:hypothetical protein